MAIVEKQRIPSHKAGYVIARVRGSVHIISEIRFAVAAFYVKTTHLGGKRKKA